GPLHNVRAEIAVSDQYIDPGLGYILAKRPVLGPARFAQLQHVADYGYGSACARECNELVHGTPYRIRVCVIRIVDYSESGRALQNLEPHLPGFESFE